MIIHKDDMTEVGRALGLEEKEINNQSTILYDPEGDTYWLVRWSNRDDHLEIVDEGGCEIEGLTRRLEVWVEAQYHEMAHCRGRWLRKLRLRQLEKLVSAPERVLKQLQAAR